MCRVRRQRSRRDQWISIGVMLAGTVVLTLAWMVLHVKVGDDPYVDAFSAMPFLVPMLLTMPLTYLEGLPRASRVVFIGGNLVLLVMIGLLAGFVASRI